MEKFYGADITTEDILAGRVGREKIASAQGKEALDKLHTALRERANGETITVVVPEEAADHH